MHLHRLTLTNVRQFALRTFEFQPGFNLLVGENGTGKTTILRGLLAALGSVQQTGILPRLGDDDIRLRARLAEVSATIRLANDIVKEYQFRKTFLEPAKRPVVRGRRPLLLFYSSNEATCSAMKVQRAKLKRAKRLSGMDNESLRRSEEFLYRLERELIEDPTAADARLFGSSHSVRSFVEGVLSAFSPEMSSFFWRFEPYDCTLVHTDSIESKRLLGPNIKKQVEAFAMRSFQEGWSERQKYPAQWPDQAKVFLAPRVSEAESGNRYLPRLAELWDEMSLSDGDRELLQSYSLEVKLAPRIMIRRSIGTLNLNQLSDGEQRLFSLFVDIARQLSMNSPNDEFGEGEAIVLIDEIDVHLHPKWQRRIVPALEDLFPNCQFIATTHSPFVIQATRREQITSIDPGGSISHLGGGNSLEDIAEEIQGVSVPQRSFRSETLNDAAKHYFTLLKMRDSDPGQIAIVDLQAAEQSYREASEPFASDPAVHALLAVLAAEGNSQ